MCIAPIAYRISIPSGFNGRMVRGHAAMAPTTAFSGIATPTQSTPASYCVILLVMRTSRRVILFAMRTNRWECSSCESSTARFYYRAGRLRGMLILRTVHIIVRTSRWLLHNYSHHADEPRVTVFSVVRRWIHGAFSHNAWNQLVSANVYNLRLAREGLFNELLQKLRRITCILR